ncbi:DEAD-box ATP-dependent RNA helicase 28 [Hordeum vulgare]|nr:DEAD-box ATP-dependent RNA helicase 28 [Hordeum vulgare]
MEKLGYPDSTKYKVYWLLPGQRIVDGLSFVCDDGDLQKLISTVPVDSNVILFFDQMYVNDNSIWDDVLIESNVPELPSVIMSPCKSTEQFLGQPEEDITAKMNEKLERLHKLKSLKEDDGDSDRLDSDANFFDSDNDPLDGDDDMFAAFVDQDVKDSMIPDKGKEQVQGNEVVGDILHGLTRPGGLSRMTRSGGLTWPVS